MSIENIRLFIQERLRAMDSTINLDDGSPASIQVVEPLVTRMSPDPYDTDLKEFILTRLQQEYPQLSAADDSALADLVVKPLSVILEPLRRERKAIGNSSSFANETLITSTEVDALMRNFFTERKTGSYAQVKVRIYYQNPVSENISGNNIAYTATGLRFLPTHAQSITAEGMLFNRDSSGLYYFDVTFQAERPGSAYRVAANEIVGVTSISASTRATNPSRASGGADEETNSEFIDRVESGMSERSVTTAPGTLSILSEEFDDLRILQVIGYNDTEMGRDVLTGGNLGNVVHYGLAGSTTDDGDADGWTSTFSDSSGNFTTTFGPVGTDLSSYVLIVWYNNNPHDFNLGQVEGATAISISSVYGGNTALPDSLSGSVWSIRKKTLLISDIPGGLQFPDVSTGSTVEVPDDTVHIGGCADIFIRGVEVEDKTVSFSLISDESTIASKEDARTTLNSDEVILYDVSADEWADIVPGKTSLYLEQGADEGSYRILELIGTSPYTVRITEEMQATATDISYSLVDDIDISLTEPKEYKYIGSDLRTIAGQPILDTLSGSPDFVGVGVVDTDYVRIINGTDAGEYAITSGGVMASQITLQQNMTVTSSPLGYEIYRKQDGIDPPLLRVKTVELLSSSGEPTGEFIPYRMPIDAVSRSFQNPGREPKAGTTISITLGTYLKCTTGTAVATACDDVGADLTSVDWYALGVRAGDILNINTSDNQGYYTVLWAGGDPDPNNPLTQAYDIMITDNFRWTSTNMEFEVGPPSYGSFRVYFLDPVTFETTYAETLFSVTLGGTTYRYRPDPDIMDEFLPTSVTIPTLDIQIGSNLVIPYSVGGSSNLDLLIHDVSVEDRIEITYAPLVGSEELSTGGYNLDGYTLKIDVGNGTETITFSGTSLNIDSIISQINTQLSVSSAYKFEDPGAAGDFYLMLRGDYSITIKDNSAASSDATGSIFGTNQQTWNPWLPASTFVGVDVDNESPEKGYYKVSNRASYPTGALTLTELDGTAWTAGTYAGGDVIKELGHYCRIARQGRQRISSTSMEGNVDELGLYYVDIECISEGHGNAWNLAADAQATLSGYYSEGWNVTVPDQDLSYSMAELPSLDMTPRVLFVGSSNDPTEKRELVGESVQIVYEQDPLVEQIHDFMRDPSTRVLCKNPLTRSLLPTFVRTNIEYNGGDEEEDIRTALVTHIEAVQPEEYLKSDDLANIIRKTGATGVTHPINLIGISHQRDRSITVERSVDFISNDRLSAMLPDDDGTTAAGASFIFLTRLL